MYISSKLHVYIYINVMYICYYIYFLVGSENEARKGEVWGMRLGRGRSGDEARKGEVWGRRVGGGRPG